MESSSPVHLFGRLYETVRSAERLLLVAHKKPDGDTLGSSSSFLNWCLREGKDVSVFCLDEPAAQFRYIDNIHRYSNDPAVFDRAYDLVIVFDSGDLRYCGVDIHMPRIPAGYTMVNIDHHVTNTRYADLNIVLTDASSTAEVVHRFYEHNGVHIDDKMATSLLTGLCTDTSNFSNAATNPKAVAAAADLVGRGARFQDILKYIWNNQSIDALKLWGLMLSRLTYNPTYDVATTYLLQSDAPGTGSDVADGLSNFLNAVTGTADAVLVLKELPGNQVKGSFRSMNRDISKIAKLMGGGGHKKAAGFTVQGRIKETTGGPVIVQA
jgi:phosphoesterase RecJ-like protein